MATCVGNDVVDLCLPEIEEHHRRDQFVSRVCTPEERARLGDDPKRMLWTLFAAKEAAYKVLVKAGHQPGFAHRAIVVSADLRSVVWGERKLHLAVDANEVRVHAVAWVGDGAFVSGVEAASGDLGVDARAFLCRSVAPILGSSPDTLSVARAPDAEAWDGYAPPRLLVAGAPAPMDVSLSHDGRFVAFAAAIVAA